MTTTSLLVNNSGTADTRTYRQSWVNNIQDWATSVENTNPAYVLSGKLAPYVNNNLRVYKCPCRSIQWRKTGRGCGASR